MGKHEGSKQRLRLSAVWGSGKIGAAIVAVIAALAFSAPAYADNSSSLTITQNTSMIVNVSGGSGSTYGSVSLSDVSWADSYCH
jgi:hypothetical protein